MNRKDAKEIKNLIGQGKLKRALDLFGSMLGNDDPDRNTFLALSSQFRALERQNLIGTISHDDYRLSLNRITSALLSLLETTEQTSREVEGKASESENSSVSARDYLSNEVDAFYKAMLKEEQLRVNMELRPSQRSLEARKEKMDVNIMNLRDRLKNSQIELEKLLDVDSPDYEDLSKLQKQLQETQLQESFDSDKIIEIAEKILERDIRISSANDALSTAYLNIGKYENAILYLNRLLDVTAFPRNIEVMLRKAAAFRELDNLDAAIRILQDAQGLKPDDDLVIETMGRYRWEKQDVGLAEALFREAIAIAPDSRSAYLNLADLYVEMGKYQEAIDQFLRAIQLDLNDSDDVGGAKFYYPYLRLGQIYHTRLKDEQRAEKYLEKSYEISGENKLVITELAKFRSSQGKIEEAVELYQGYLSRNEEDLDIRQSLAKLYQEQGDTDRAIQLLEDGFSGRPSPEHLPALFEWIKLLIDQVQWQKALEILEQWQKEMRDLDSRSLSYPGQFQFQKYMGILLFRVGSPNEMSVYDRALDSFLGAAEHPEAEEDEELWRELSKLYGEKEEIELAEQHKARADRIAGKAKFVYNKQHPLSLSRIFLNEVYFFDDTSWHCQPGINVILGRNGYGKSYFLRFLVSLLQEEDQISAPIISSGISKAEFIIDFVREGHQKESIKRNRSEVNRIGKIPVLAIPDVRFLDKSRETVAANDKEKGDLADHGAFHFLFQQTFQGLIQNFLFFWSHRFNDRRKSNESARETFEQMPIFRLLENVFRSLTGSYFAFHDIKAEDQDGQVRYRIEVITEGNQRRPLPLQKASQGTLSVMSMFGLIYHYLEILYPKVPKSALPLQPAIVIIDEVDAHLHPSWQRKIVYLLRKTFPKVQFFLTAHSPLVIGGCDKNEVSVLRKNKKTGQFYFQQIHHHFIGWDPSDLYREVFAIEGLDETYLELQEKYAVIDSLKAQIADLKSKPDRSLIEEENLRSLQRRVEDLSVFDQIDKGRRGDLREQLEDLEAEYRQLQYEYNLLKQNQQTNAQS